MVFVTHVIIAVVVLGLGIWRGIDPGALGLMCGIVLGHGVAVERAR